MTESHHSHLKSLRFKEENGSFALKTCKFVNLTWKPVASTLFSTPTSKNLQFSTRNKTFKIHSNYQGFIGLRSYRNEAYLLALCVHLSVKQSVLRPSPSHLLDAFSNYLTDREGGRSRERWVGRVYIKILSSVFILCNHSTDLHGRSASLWGLRGNTAKRWCFFSSKKKKNHFITRCSITSETFSFSTYVTYIPSGEASY